MPDSRMRPVVLRRISDISKGHPWPEMRWVSSSACAGFFPRLHHVAPSRWFRQHRLDRHLWRSDRCSDFAPRLSLSSRRIVLRPIPEFNDGPFGLLCADQPDFMLRIGSNVSGRHQRDIQLDLLHSRNSFDDSRNASLVLVVVEHTGDMCHAFFRHLDSQS